MGLPSILSPSPVILLGTWKIPENVPSSQPQIRTSNVVMKSCVFPFSSSIFHLKSVCVTGRETAFSKRSPGAGAAQPLREQGGLVLANVCLDEAARLEGQSLSVAAADAVLIQALWTRG